MAEPLRIKGSDGKTYLNPKADRDIFARFLDSFIQMLDGSAYGPDYNRHGNPKPQISLDENEVPVITSQESLSEPPVPPAETQRFDNTLEGQYQRYFQTPEMDYVFGAGARGKDAPKDASAMEVLGNQLQAPAKDTNISSMYAAQSAMGRVNEDAIQKMYEGNEAMQTWAKANPMLAQREYLKAQKGRADQAPLGLDNETPYGDLGTRAQYDNPMGQEAYARIRKELMNKAAQK